MRPRWLPRTGPDPRALIEAFSRQRLSFLKRLSTWASFGRGGSEGVAATRKAALALAGPGSLPSGRKKETKPMTKPKSLFWSCTVWANLVGLDAVLLSIFGFDTSTMDSPGMADAIEQSVAGISFLASTIFRVIATRRLAMM
jgi:lysozyme family protein